MKLKNILSAICLIFILASCSSENDVLDDMGNTIEQEGANQAYLSLQLGTNDVSTRTDVVLDKDIEGDGIQSYVLFLLEGSKSAGYKVVSVVTENVSQGADGYYPTTVDTKILTKVKSNLAVLVVANPGGLLDELTGCKTYREIAELRSYLNYRFMVSDLKPVVWGSIQGTPSTKDEAELAKNTLNLGEIVVNQRTAIVALPKFYVNYIGNTGSRPVVKLTNVTYYNMKTTVGLFDEGTANASEDVDGFDAFYDGNNLVAEPIDAMIKGDGDNNDRLDELYRPIYMDVCPNTDAGKPVTVKIEFTVTENNTTRTEEREYVVNPANAAGSDNIPAYVNAGYFYNLIVTVNVGKDINVELLCSTKDWKDNTVDIPATNITGK